MFSLWRNRVSFGSLRMVQDTSFSISLFLTLNYFLYPMPHAQCPMPNSPSN
ncbi:MAG: hypothetical protein AAF630_04360 [Cyanobacteria bacterium P01_C01_bin.38]